jgi:hypothetical protein
VLVSPLPLGLVIDIVNGWSESVREAAAVVTPPPAVAELAAAHRAAAPPTEPMALAAWAERLHRVFAAPTGPQRLDALNDSAGLIDPLPVATAAGPAWRVRRDADQLPARMVLTLFEHARHDAELDRLGVCAAHNCVDAFADTTQARTRRYCSTTCQNRAKTAARRARMC